MFSSIYTQVEHAYKSISLISLAFFFFRIVLFPLVRLTLLDVCTLII